MRLATRPASRLIAAGTLLLLGGAPSVVRASEDPSTPPRAPADGATHERLPTRRIDRVVAPWTRLTYAVQAKLLLTNEKHTRDRLARRLQHERLEGEFDRIVQSYPEVHERYMLRRPHRTWDAQVLSASWAGLALSLVSSISDGPIAKAAGIGGLTLIGTGLLLSRVDDILNRTAQCMALREALSLAAGRGELAYIASPELVSDLARHLNRTVPYPAASPAQ